LNGFLKVRGKIRSCSGSDHLVVGSSDRSSSHVLLLWFSSWLLLLLFHVVVIGLTDADEVSIEGDEYDGLSENGENVDFLGGLLVSLLVLWVASSGVNGILLVEENEVAEGPDSSKSDRDEGELAGWSELSSSADAVFGEEDNEEEY